MSTQSLRAAVIGLGMGSQHLAAYAQIPGVEVAAFCDVNPVRLQMATRDYPGARAVTDWREIVRDPDVHLASVCTPDGQHFEQAAALALAGKHVLCEKPMVTSVADARALQHIVRNTGVTLAVGNVNRFVPQFAHVARLAAEGRLGDLFMVESDYIHDMRGVFIRTPWRVDPQAPQNAIFGGGVHPVDLARWVAGEPVTVFASGNHKTVPEYNSHDNVLINLQFASGCIGKVWITFGIHRRPEHVVNLNAFGSEANVYTDSERPEARLYLPAVEDNQRGWLTTPFAPLVGHPVLEELTHFVDCIRGGRAPLVDVTDGARTVAVLEAAQRSLESGAAVAVEDALRPFTGAEQLLMRLPALRGPYAPQLPPGYTLRAYRTGDEQAFLDLCNPAMGMAWTPADFALKMSGVPWFSPDRLFFVERDGRPVGTACAWQETADETRVGYTHMVAVRPDERGRGLGRALMLRVLRWFDEHGFSESVLNTDEFRLPAIALYESLGFEPVYRDPSHHRRWGAVRAAQGAR